MRTLLEPPLDLASSSSLRRFAFPLTAFLLPLSSSFFDLGASLSSAPAGSSTMNRYLHLGQSILRPIKSGSRMGTNASQLGHCCLKAAALAMIEISASEVHHLVNTRRLSISYIILTLCVRFLQRVF